jgi:hypothetical protein
MQNLGNRARRWVMKSVQPCGSGWVGIYLVGNTQSRLPGIHRISR